MRNSIMIHLTVGSALVCGFIVLATSLSLLQFPGYVSLPQKSGTISIVDTVVAPEGMQRKEESFTPVENFDTTMFDSANEDITAYWLGSLPEVLRDSVNTEGLQFIDSTAFNKSVPQSIKELYINADGVPNIATFTNSPAFQTIVQNKVRVIIYNNRTSLEDEKLISALGGVNTFDAEFTMINYKEYGRSIVPVGNNDMWYNPKRLSIFQKATFDAPYTGGINKTNARAGAIPCYDTKVNRTIRYQAQNRFPLKEEKSKTYYRILKRPFPHREYLYYVNGTKQCEKFWMLRELKVLKSTVVQHGQQITFMQAGTGQQTHRENQSRTESKTVGNTYDWKLSTSFGKKFEFGLSESVKLSLSFKASKSYRQSKSNGWTNTLTISEGHTFYTNACAYACCDYEGSIDVLQDTYEVKNVSVGDIWVLYKDYKLRTNRSSPTKVHKLKRWVTLRFNFTRTSPYHSTYKEMSDMYVSFEMKILDEKCKPKSCYGYTSGQCDGTVK